MARKFEGGPRGGIRAHPCDQPFGHQGAPVIRVCPHEGCNGWGTTTTGIEAAFGARSGKDPRPILGVRIDHATTLTVHLGQTERAWEFSDSCVEFGASTTSGHDVGPAGLDLLGVIAAFRLRLDVEPRRLQQVDHCRRLEEAKIEIDALAPELVDVSDLVTDVERNKEASTGNQHPPEFGERGCQLVRAEVDDRVERRQRIRTPRRSPVGRAGLLV